MPESGSGKRQADMIERLFRLLERQIHRIANQMASAGSDETAADVERQARTLASMVRVLDRLVELKGASAVAPDASGQEQDADRIRLEIAQRLERMLAEEEG